MNKNELIDILSDHSKNDWLFKEADKIYNEGKAIQGEYEAMADRPHVLLDDEKGSFLLTWTS